jgi:uncharacterized membrane protein
MIRIMRSLKNTGVSWQKALPYLLVIGGIIGLVASFALTYDKIQLLQHADYKPSCNLNPVLSCGSVMKTAQANLFGIPNTIFGLVAFTMVTTLGAVVLAGATFKRWLWQIAQLVATVGILFMHYLFFEAVFRIHAICPWCFLVWMVTIPLFFSLTIYNIRENNLRLSRSAPLRAAVAFIDRYAVDLLVLWYLLIFAILAVRFWYYWRTLLPG